MTSQDVLQGIIMERDLRQDAANGMNGARRMKSGKEWAGSGTVDKPQ
jgi:hypothetical protein